MKQQPAKKRTSTKSKAVKTSTKTPKRHLKDWRIIGEWYIAVPLAILLVFVAGYLARGWIRYHAEPTAVSWSVSGDLQKELNKQLSDLGDPFKSVGVDQKNASHTCSLLYANGFHSDFYCGFSYNGSSNQVSGLKPVLADRSSILEIAFKENGWSNVNTNITQLGTNIGKNIDYTPDAAYQKNIGKFSCVVDFNTAFSKPRKPAINVTAGCVRIYSILGNTKAFPSLY